MVMHVSPYDSSMRPARLPRTIHAGRIDHISHHVPRYSIVVVTTSRVPMFPCAVLDGIAHRLNARLLGVINLTVRVGVEKRELDVLLKLVLVQQRLSVRVRGRDTDRISERVVVVVEPVKGVGDDIGASSRDDVVDDGYVRPGSRTDARYTGVLLMRFVEFLRLDANADAGTCNSNTQSDHCDHDTRGDLTAREC